MAETSTRRPSAVDRSWLDGWQLDAIVTVLSLVLVAGVAFDFRAHANGISFAEEGFVTPTHVVFYSMFLAIAAVIGAHAFAERRSGASWVEAVPAGYGVGVLGVVLFGFAGVADFLWHSTFGFENGLEGLTSPSHLLIAISAGLFLSSPARATWRRTDITGGLRSIPAVVSGGLTLTIAVFFTGYLNPLMIVYTDVQTDQTLSLGIGSMIVFPALVVGAMLMFARRFSLPLGAYTLLVAIPSLASVVPLDNPALFVPGLVMGLAADAVAAVAPPTPDRPRSFRLFGAVVPFVFATSYVATTMATTGMAWTIHVWAGAIVFAAFAGLLLTYFLLPTTRVETVASDGRPGS